MTFPCSLRFEPDTAKAPGYGFLLASCPGFAGNAEALLFMIRNASGNSIGPNGWQAGDGWLRPDAVQASGDTLLVSVGPAVVNPLAEWTSYQVFLFIDMEHVWQGTLGIEQLVGRPTPPPVQMAPAAQAAQPQAGSLDLLDMGTPSREAPRQEVSRQETQLPLMQPLSQSRQAPATQPAPGLALSLGGANTSAVPQSDLLIMAERPKRYFGAVLNVFFAILTVGLLGAAGFFIYTEVLPKTEAAKEEPPVEILKQEAADVKPGTEVPVKYAPEDLKGTRGLSVARDAIKRKIPPETALALAQQLLAMPKDLKAQDGGRLILEDLAQKNNGQALLLLGDVYAPSQPSRGSIQKNAAFAKDCYTKALAAGAAEAQKRLEQLR